MDRKLRIGLFIDTYFPMIDGVVMVVDNYARRLARKADVTVFAPESRDKEYRDDFPYRVVRCKCVDLGRLDYTLPVPALDFRFIDDLLHEKLDVVHVHSPFTVGRLGVSYARVHRIPAVATMHSQYRQDFKRFVKLDFLSDLMVKDVIAMYRRCDECWAVNASVAKIFHEQYGFPTLPRVQGNATDMEPVPDRAAARAAIREKYAIPDRARIFLFVGRLNKLKGILFLADALARFREYGVPFRMLFVGDGQDREELERKIAADGIADSVVFCGRLTDRDVLAAHYAAADLFLFPSLYDASSLVQIEAACQGVPAVFLKGAATADAVIDGVNGFLSEHTPEAYAARIRDALEPETLRAASGAAFRDLYRGFDDVVEDIYRRYEELVEEKREKRKRKKAPRKGGE